MFFFTANFHSSPNLEKKLALTVASLQRFSIGEQKELLEWLSNILGAYLREQTIGYYHILFNYAQIIIQ